MAKHEFTESELKEMCNEIRDISGLKIYYHSYGDNIGEIVAEQEDVFQGTTLQCAYVLGGMYVMAELQKEVKQ